MNKKALNFALVIGCATIIFALVKNILNQPGVNDLKAGFKEVAKYRNENNTGPVQRIFIVTVKDSLWQEMVSYGNYMPHNKYGNTKVYFFMENSKVPRHLEPGEINFDVLYNSYCIARYEKSAMSQVGFSKYPFK